ncbi:hypothetical protein [Nonomuraea sp. B19D2]|uniref:hypothetical protein n=1 Tax=Nonomuraea sp. B19D2 TaxID=3159561 RepID=UPI0032DA8929
MNDAAKGGRALVVGLGIAGIATTVRLRQVGWEPVLTPRCRTMWRSAAPPPRPPRITQDDFAAEVTLRDTASGATVTEHFDLVVGADGLRPTVRTPATAPQPQQLDHGVVAGEVPAGLGDVAQLVVQGLALLSVAAPIAASGDIRCAACEGALLAVPRRTRCPPWCNCRPARE